MRESGWMVATVWTLRVVVGAVFVLSGFAKMVDLWGFVFKIEEYLAVWGWMQPRSIVVTAAMGIAAWEFLLGLMLAMGCYKRVAPWGLLVTMAFMLPLTAYIAVADPVDDCGCFGDMWKMGNTATFLKNVALTAALGFLAWGNPKVRGALFQPAIQWVVVVWSGLYIIIVGLYGYNVQPMVDFRSYPVGTLLDPEETDLAVFDAEGEDVTSDVLARSGRQLLLVIPELKRADISYTYYINELAEYADSASIPLVGLVGAGARGLQAWRDISMAQYPLYTADETSLKELARGNLSLVVLQDGHITSKMSVSAIDPDELEGGIAAGEPLGAVTVDPGGVWRYLTYLFGGVLAALALFQGMVLAISSALRRRYGKNKPAKAVRKAEDTEDTQQPTQSQNQKS